MLGRTFAKVFREPTHHNAYVDLRIRQIGSYYFSQVLGAALLEGPRLGLGKIVSTNTASASVLFPLSGKSSAKELVMVVFHAALLKVWVYSPGARTRRRLYQVSMTIHQDVLVDRKTQNEPNSDQRNKFREFHLSKCRNLIYSSYKL